MLERKMKSVGGTLHKNTSQHGRYSIIVLFNFVNFVHEFSLDLLRCSRYTMIFHLVLLKIKPSASGEQLDNLAASLKSLSGIPGVLSIQFEQANKCVYVGYDDRTKGYTHALMVILADKKALEVYDKDTLHQLVKSTVIKPVLDTTVNDPVLAVDWEGEAPELSSKCSLVKHYGFYLAAVGALSLAGFVALRYRSRL